MTEMRNSSGYDLTTNTNSKESQTYGNTIFDTNELTNTQNIGDKNEPSSDIISDTLESTITKVER